MIPKPKVFHRQRKYNQWVANETLEDFALRYTAKRSRKWSVQRVASTALGIVSFLALEAIGGAITLNYGFTNSFYAISIVCILIFLTGFPICYSAAKAGIDIDLLTRGAGFGYLGSTISSLIYASFTFIFFALEAAIMSMAINILFNIPLSISYVISTLVVIPLVTHGISRISIFQIWTQPFWFILQISPIIIIIINHQNTLTEWTSYSGINQSNDGFNLLMFGAAAAVIFPLLAQNGEQVDFLRFLPAKNQGTKRWWWSLIFAGPGWAIVGFFKLLIGSFLAVLALKHGVDLEFADDPTHMYTVAFSYITHNQSLALAMAGIFVIISQLKINVTNAYAGSIAWSNFFSRVTRSHPGRFVWLFFNVGIALLLMELGLYHAFESILITYSALVLSWIGSLVADLTINQMLGLRPKEIYFKRSELFDINPVGVLSMIMASTFGIAAQLGAFNPQIKALSPFIVLLLPFITVPLIAYLTKGQYYRVKNTSDQLPNHLIDINKQAECKLCENKFDIEDMSYCSFYSKPICSLCCALESRCNDHCRETGTLKVQSYNSLNFFLPSTWSHALNSNVGSFIIAFISISLVNLFVFSLVYYSLKLSSDFLSNLIYHAFYQLFFLLLIISGVLTWLYVLANSSRHNALQESRQQMILLQEEIFAHKKTEQKLQAAKESADNANQAKTRYLSGVSHELRTPLNTVYGYAQLMERNTSLPDSVRKAAKTISKNGEHITDIIEGLLEISKIEARRVDYLHKESINIDSLLAPIVETFTMQAHAKNIDFNFKIQPNLPQYVSTDAKRIRQILMNLLSNAIKFTPQGAVTLSLNYRNEVAKFSINDTGIGINQEDLKTIFEPFKQAQGHSLNNISGTGLGLSISRLLAELLGGQIEVSSCPGRGSCFTLSVLLPAVSVPVNGPVIQDKIIGYHGKQKRIMIVDDEFDHRRLIQHLLTPLNFHIIEANGHLEALKLLATIDIDLFLLDISMPHVNGWTLAQQFLDLGYSAPVIMLSGNAIENHKGQLTKQLHDYYLIKPVNFNELLEKISLSLGLHWVYDHDNTLVPNHGSVNHSPRRMILPPPEQLINIKQAASIGHIKGVESSLILIKKSANQYTAFITAVEHHMQSFNLLGILELIEGTEGD